LLGETPFCRRAFEICDRSLSNERPVEAIAVPRGEKKC